MKIGIFTPYLDSITGGEKYILTLAQCLSKNNEVFIFWDEATDLKKIQERFKLDLSKVRLTPNIFSKNLSRVARFQQTRKYDCIIVLSDGSIPIVFSKKLFLHFQYPVEWIHLNAKMKLKLLRVSKIFCNSYFTKELIDKKLHVKSVVLYPPVDLISAIGKKENVILHVGRFAGNKREGDDFKKQGVMVEVFKKMVQKNISGWKFVIATSVREEERVRFEEFKKSVKGLPIEFVINANNKTIEDTYKKAKIYWHATGFGENLEKYPERAEHFGISTVEAMGAGAVPVVINAGGQKEIVTNNEDGFLWDTLEELESKTLSLIANTSLWNKLSKNASTRAQLFSKDRFCKQVYEIISS